MKRRIGKFQVHGGMLRGSNFEYIMAIQKDMAVLHMEHESWVDRVTFYATGPMFEEVDEGSITPSYNATITLGDDGTITATFTKVDNCTVKNDISRSQT